jgi:hypothetical protein
MVEDRQNKHSMVKAGEDLVALLGKPEHLPGVS